MSAIDKRIQELAFLALGKISEIAKGAAARDAKLAFAAIQQIVAAVGMARARQITPAELAEKIEGESRALGEKLADNKTKILAELDKQFPA